MGRGENYNGNMIREQTGSAARKLKKLLTPLMAATLFLSVISLFLEQSELIRKDTALLIQIIDFSITALILSELFLDFFLAPFKISYLKKNLPGILLSLFYLAVFTYNKVLLFSEPAMNPLFNGAAIILVRNFFLIFKVYLRFRRVSHILGSFTIHPAQTLVLSFAMVILAGTFYLMLPITTIDGRGLGFIDALFTTTSAVCVTGLIVADTAVFFTLAGQAGILVLIQIGGLGIMILSYFAAFALKRQLSVQDKLLLAYMMEEEDMSRLSRGLFSIIALTFGIEAGGALILSGGFLLEGYGPLSALWYGLFHSISAFCNAGFALFSNSLEGFSRSPLINLTVALLIIAGGISFAVLSQIQELIRGALHRDRRKPFRLSAASRLVLSLSAFLLISGTLLFYILEHRGILRGFSLGHQYLAAFFQSVTLRTAGFNTVPLAGMGGATLLFMLIWMFIGGASGSTAGGIKVNTLGVLLLYLRSRFRGNRQIVMGSTAIEKEGAENGFLLLFFGLTAVAVGFFLLLLTESGALARGTAAFEDLLFETISAFGTVGLSLGLTGNLSPAGKLVISLLMFMGRLGPLTLLTALGRQKSPQGFKIAETVISVG